MFNQVQVRALAGSLKDMHRFVLELLLPYLGCVLGVVLLGGEPSPQAEVLGVLKKVFIQDVSVQCCIHLSLHNDKCPSSCS